MNIITRIWKRLTEGRDLGINTPGWLDYFAFGGGNRVNSGARVSEEGALSLVVVYACVTYIADYIASLPKITYQREDKGKRRATDHYLYPIIHDRL